MGQNYCLQSSFSIFNIYFYFVCSGSPGKQVAACLRLQWISLPIDIGFGEVGLRNIRNYSSPEWPVPEKEKGSNNKHWRTHFLYRTEAHKKILLFQGKLTFSNIFYRMFRCLYSRQVNIYLCVNGWRSQSAGLREMLAMSMQHIHTSIERLEVNLNAFEVNELWNGLMAIKTICVKYSIFSGDLAMWAKKGNITTVMKIVSFFLHSTTLSYRGIFVLILRGKAVFDQFILACLLCDVKK